VSYAQKGCGILCSAKLSILQETQKSLILKEALLVFARILCSAKKKYEHTSSEAFLYLLFYVVKL